MAQAFAGRVLWLLLSIFVVGSAAEESSCPAGAGASCAAKAGDANHSSTCISHGFDPEKLGCKTCRLLEKRLLESGAEAAAVLQECLGCCQQEPVVEKWNKARLIADASQQDRDQDLHDFIKRKAPRIRNLEVDYQEGSWPAFELEMTDYPDRVLRADVRGWKSEHLVEFLSTRLEAAAEDQVEGGDGGIKQGWSAEIQSCSGWRLNQLPEARRFIKEPGHADTYVGLKVNFIPHHNPDLVFFNEHGEEKERLDLGRYNLQQIHSLMEEKGFKRKEAKKYRGEIRTCSGWRLNQLPQVRKFVLGKGNADSYVGLKLNFVPHHPPVFYMFDGEGKEVEQFDISTYDLKGLQDLMAEKGFKKKELL